MFRLITTYFIILRFVISQQTQSCGRITVRKEMHDLTDQEWEIYTTTIRAAAQMPGTTGGRTVWEEFAQFHISMAQEIHGNCQFLPWHRMFLSYAERRLQQINPNFAFFYWDSAREW